MVSERLSPQLPFAFGSLKVNRLLASPSSGLLACATALDHQGEWVAIGINRQLEVAWTQAIGPQEFDRQIQPIASLALDADHSVWAFASSDDTIAIVSDDGRIMDWLQWPAPVQGLVLAKLNGKTCAIVSDLKQVSATPLVFPVSSSPTPQ